VRFYDREKEISTLLSAQKLSSKTSQMSVIVGRRRIGKTRLILEAFKNSEILYFFVAKKDESLLCSEFLELFREKTGTGPIGKIDEFRSLFEFIMKEGENREITVAIDEFQEFYNINPSIYSDMQNIWDRYKEKSKVHLILCGSAYSLMKKIFENSKEPLFGRADRKINLKPFDVFTIGEVLKDTGKKISSQDLLSFFILTGGIPKYCEIFRNENAYNSKKMIDTILSSDSFFIDEGKKLLVEEFGKEYSTYFSILSLLASSRTSRGEIESTLGKNVGGYLSRMESDYGIIRKVRPIFSKKGSRNQKYLIEDNFLNFWFRFIYKYRSSVEIENYDYIKKIIDRDFRMFSGPMLEKYFIEKLKFSKEFSDIGSYWERGNANEIDIVAVNKMEKKMLIAEVKINPKKIDIDILKEKAKNLILGFHGWNIEYKGFSMDDVQILP